jgi:uncharacterized cupin superfamily protein
VHRLGGRLSVLAHWDEVEPVRQEAGDIRGEWQALGDAAGSDGVGLNRIRVDPGCRSTALHVHGASEEIFYVLGGSGLLWQDEATHEIGPGDCIVHLRRANDHTLVAGGDGLDVLVFGTRHPTEFGSLPRARVIRFGHDAVPWVEESANPWELDVAAGPVEPPPLAPRPANVVALADAETGFGGAARFLARSAGSRRSGLNHLTLPPGASGAPPHCHSLEEELFVALEGRATLLLYPRGARRDAEPERHGLRAGHVVARPPGTGLAHAFEAGPDGCTLLLYGTREPNDMTYYPLEEKIALRGLGVAVRPDAGDV